MWQSSVLQYVGLRFLFGSLRVNTLSALWTVFTLCSWAHTQISIFYKSRSVECLISLKEQRACPGQSACHRQSACHSACSGSRWIQVMNLLDSMNPAHPTTQQYSTDITQLSLSIIATK